MTLAGKVAVITGSTSGIGLGIAEALAAQGCAIVLNGIESPEQIDPLLERLKTTYSVPVAYSNANMRHPEEITELVQQASELTGRVDILVNNAGIQHVAPLETFPAEKWEAIVAINLSAAFYTTQAVLPGMRANGWGRIINVASAHGLTASPFKSAYVAAKHGVVGLTKVTALETARDGITCNALCPGYVRTPLVEKQIDDQAQAHHMAREEVIEKVLLAKQPSKQFVEVAELGAFCVFLCSDAATSVTGTALPVDGGWTAE